MSVQVATELAPPVVVVERWKRYGHDRAYVRNGSRDVGYRDLLTGDAHCAERERELVTSATDEMYARVRAAQRAGAPPHGTAPVLTLVQGTVETGELDVERRLNRLGRDWRVVHGVPVGRGNTSIDHLVIGPAGVFTVDAKNHPQACVSVKGDTVQVDGCHRPYVRTSRHEAAWVALLLGDATGEDVDVRGIVAVVGAHRGFTVTEQPRDGRVTVLTRTELLSHLRELPARLDAATVDRIDDAARRLSF